MENKNIDLSMKNMKNAIKAMHEMMKKMDSKQLRDIGINISNDISSLLKNSNIDRESECQIIQLLHNHQIHDYILIKMIFENKKTS